MGTHSRRNFSGKEQQGNFEQEVTELTEAEIFDLGECVACSSQQILNRTRHELRSPPGIVWIVLTLREGQDDSANEGDGNGSFAPSRDALLKHWLSTVYQRLKMMSVKC
jgi:hypothetical protein